MNVLSSMQNKAKRLAYLGNKGKINHTTTNLLVGFVQLDPLVLDELKEATLGALPLEGNPWRFVGLPSRSKRRQG